MHKYKARQLDSLKSRRRQCDNTSATTRQQESDNTIPRGATRRQHEGDNATIRDQEGDNTTPRGATRRQHEGDNATVRDLAYDNTRGDMSPVGFHRLPYYPPASDDASHHAIHQLATMLSTS